MNTAEITDDVRRAAYITARRWADVIDADDAEQEIWVRLLERDYVDRVVEMEEHARVSALVRIGRQVASQYRDDYEVFSGQVHYGTDEVRRMLSSGLLGRTREELDPSSETLSEFVDLHEAAQSLRDSNRHYADVIGTVYLFREELTDRKRLTRAVDALTREMNRVSQRRPYDDGPGTRQVVSNATARAVTE